MNRTKIVCTIGPASEKQAVLSAMMKAGMGIARMNMSHGTYAWHARAIRSVRSVSKKLGEPTAILLDLQGPKVRIGDLSGKTVELKKGESVVFTTASASGGKIPIDYPMLHREVKKGHRLLLADGLRECVVESVSGKDIHARVTVGGALVSHKGVNLPDTTISLQSLTPKDKKDLVFGVKEDVDFMAFSFARTGGDVRELRRLIDRAERKKRNPIRIIVKIEKHEAVKNFDDILAEADGVMVARGDLALEVPSEQVPIIQKEIIEKCRRAGKPVIVATEMLASMEKNPRPTRAELSDVANAVIDHTDATMLSGESAMGVNPAQTVATMSRIIEEAEKSRFDNVGLEQGLLLGAGGDEEALMATAAILSKLTGARALIVGSMTGRSVRLIARARVEIPILAGSPDRRVVRQMNLSWGVRPVLAPFSKKPESVIAVLMAHAKKILGLKHGDRVVFVSGSNMGAPQYESLTGVRTVE